MAGYASAKAKKEEAARLAAQFDYARSPDGFNKDVFDRMLASTGAQAIKDGYYGVDMGAETARRGQDLESADRRYNTDVTARTNLDQTRLNNTKDVTTSMLAPVAQGATRFVPGSIAEMFGVPEQQVGTVNVGQDAKVVTPDGRTIVGQPKPLGETEWRAAQNERLRQSGKLSDDMLLNAVLGDKAPVQAVGPGGKPQYMSPGAAVRSGAEPYNPSADKSLVEGTTVINGKSVQVFRKPNDSNYYTADGKPVPPDVQVYDKAKPTGTNEQLGMKPTEFTQKNAMFYNRAASATANLTRLQTDKGYVPSARDYELMLGRTGEVLPLSLSNTLVSDDGRQFYNSAMNFMLSVLRPDTGAAFGRDEFQNYARVFIPLPNDDPETLASKATARDTALAALQGSSAGAADQITRMMQANGVEVPPEMLAHMHAAQQAAGAGPQATPGAPAASEAGDPLAAARAAIAKGAPREKVIERLRQNGINPEGL